MSVAQIGNQLSEAFAEAATLRADPYGFDFCPAFWEWVELSNAAGRVFSIEKVGDELLAGADDLTKWVRERGDEFFLKPDAAVVQSLQMTSQWAAAQGYDPAAVNTFLQVADYYLVAHAHAHDHVVVTHEVVAHAKKKIKIPDACIGPGVKCMSPDEMLRVERARFVLGA